MTRIGISCVVPVRCDDRCEGHDGLCRTLERLREVGVDVVVVDGSRGVAAEQTHRRVFVGVRRLPIEIDPGVNGKVRAVHIGVAAALHERVVIADDDVLFEPSLLERVARLLDGSDLVVPQNYFAEPWRWHTYWDTARTLLNRAFGHDYPGTLAVRRSMFLEMGGYDESALFENLELIRTVRAAGGQVCWASDLFVPRAGPTTSAFLRQRVRQAYDDLGQPLRLVCELSLLPLIAWGLLRHRRALGAAAAGAVMLAERGRRRHGGRQVFPFRASLAAPLWVAERASCVWVAVWLRGIKGGVLYRGSRLRKAASPAWKLRLRYATSPSRPHEHRHTGAWSEIVRIDTAGRRDGARSVGVHPRR
jgi:hypothetical protein